MLKSPEVKFLEKRARRWRRAARKRVLWALLAAFVLACCSLVALFFTSGYWIPLAAPGVSSLATGVRVSVPSLDCFPLGQISARNLTIRIANGKHDALSVDRLDVTYKRLIDLLCGRIESVSLKGFTANDIEVACAAESLRTRWPRRNLASAKSPRDLARMIPKVIDLQNGKIVATSGKAYGVRSVRTLRSDMGSKDVLLDLALETAPLKSMLSLDIDQPLRLKLHAGFTSSGIHLVDVTSNLGSLFKIEAAEPSKLKEGETIALELKNLRFDFDQWARILNLPVAGELQFDLKVPEWRFGRTAQAGPLTGGLGPDAYFTHAQLRLRPVQWDSFIKGWSLTDAGQDVSLKVASMPDLRHMWMEMESRLHANTLQTPQGPFDDLDLRLKGGATLRGDQLTWNWSGEALGPGAGQQSPAKLRLRLTGEGTGEGSIGPRNVDARFKLVPRFERASMDAFAIPMSGRIRQVDRTSTSPAFCDLVSAGELASGSLVIRALLEERRSTSITLDLANASLERLNQLGRILDYPIAPTSGSISGSLSSHAALNAPSSGPADLSSSSTLSGVQIRRADGSWALTRPVDARLDWKLSALDGLSTVCKVQKLDLQADHNVFLKATGSFLKSAKSLDMSLDPELRVESVAQLLALTSETKGLASAGRIDAKGDVDLRQTAKTARIKFHGDASLTSVAVASASGIRGNLPLTATWYQDLVNGTTERPVGVFEWALSPTTLDIDRLRLNKRQLRWLQLKCDARGRLFLNPVVDPPRPARLVMLEWDRFQAKLPGIAEAEGGLRGEWRVQEAGTAARVSGESDFTARTDDIAGLLDLLQFDVGDLRVKGGITLSQGNAKLADGQTTLSGHATLDLPSGATNNYALAWRDLKGEFGGAAFLKNGGAEPLISADGDMTVGRLTLGGIALSNVKLRTESTGTDGQLDITSCHLLDGTGEAASSVDFRKWPPSVRVSAHGYNLDLARFTDEFKPGQIAMEGKVDLSVEASYSPDKGASLEAHVTLASGDLKIDKQTVREMFLGSLAKQTGSSFFMGDAQVTLDREYRDAAMVPFDGFELTCRYADERFINTIRLKNEHFNIVIEPSIDLPVVTEFLKLKQEETVQTVH